MTKRALELNASAIILVHNHPRGDSEPSPADMAVTLDSIETLKALTITAHDHAIIGKVGDTSFKAKGLIYRPSFTHISIRLLAAIPEGVSSHAIGEALPYPITSILRSENKASLSALFIRLDTIVADDLDIRLLSAVLLLESENPAMIKVWSA